MIRNGKLKWAVVLSLVVCLAVIGVAWAQASGFAVNWRVVASGGGEMASAGHAINGTLGQFAIGPAQGADHAVGSGYWYGIGVEAGPEEHQVYLPLLARPAIP